MSSGTTRCSSFHQYLLLSLKWLVHSKVWYSSLSSVRSCEQLQLAKLQGNVRVQSLHSENSLLAHCTLAMKILIIICSSWHTSIEKFCNLCFHDIYLSSHVIYCIVFERPCIQTYKCLLLLIMAENTDKMFTLFLL
jgi:hypothetical protein